MSSESEANEGRSTFLIEILYRNFQAFENVTAPLFENFLKGKFSNKKEKQAFLHQSASQTASPEGEALKTRQKLSLPLADFSYRKNQQKLSAASRLPLGGKVPSKSEANEGRD